MSLLFFDQDANEVFKKMKEGIDFILGKTLKREHLPAKIEVINTPKKDQTNHYGDILVLCLNVSVGISFKMMWGYLLKMMWFYDIYFVETYI